MRNGRGKRAVCLILSGILLVAGSVGMLPDVATAQTVDTDFAGEMKAEGFPDSYLESLNTLHESYPQWQFEAVDTGLDWKNVIEKESKNGLNLVPKNTDDARKSTAPGAYDWFTNTWTIYDGSSWVGAHPDYIAYYMDPRNFLNETDIFQFESLSYRDAQTLDGVEAILKGTFMETDIMDTDGKNLNYAEAFMKIAKSTKISPYHLASRVRQEQGLGGNSALISGTYKGYEGYFNYFNVGASGVTASDVIVKGLSYAKTAGWDTRYKALLGGAQILSKNYISVGQDTLYFQKFNVVNKKNLYGHQYMQNLIAASTEGRKIAQGYSDRQKAFVFRIPVYHNMPGEASAFKASGNPNNYLKSLTVSGQTLTPGFKGSETKYSVVVEQNVESVKVSAAPVASTSTVTGTGTKKLAEGKNTIRVKCKSQGGSVKTYTISIVRQKSGEPDGIPTSQAYRVADQKITGIEPGTTVNSFLKKMTVEGASMKLVGADGKEGKGTVATGNRLEISDKNGKKLSSYTLLIYGDIDGDGKVNEQDMVLLNNYLLGKQKLSGIYLEAANVNHPYDKVVNVVDLVYINKYLQGTVKIEQ